MSPVSGVLLTPVLIATWLDVIAGTCAVVNALLVCALVKDAAPTISNKVQRLVYVVTPRTALPMKL